MIWGSWWEVNDGFIVSIQFTHHTKRKKKLLKKYKRCRQLDIKKRELVRITTPPQFNPIRQTSRVLQRPNQSVHVSLKNFIVECCLNFLWYEFQVLIFFKIVINHFIIPSFCLFVFLIFKQYRTLITGVQPTGDVKVFIVFCWQSYSKKKKSNQNWTRSMTRIALVHVMSSWQEILVMWVY